MSNQDTKTRFQQIRENNALAAVTQASEAYGEQSHVRNLCFVWTDGKKLFLNYAYLVSAAYEPDAITLAFTTHTLTLTGLRLEKLFDELMDHLPRIIICTDDRYAVIAGDSAPVVKDITVQLNG